MFINLFYFLIMFLGIFGIFLVIITTIKTKNIWEINSHRYRKVLNNFSLDSIGQFSKRQIRRYPIGIRQGYKILYFVQPTMIKLFLKA